MLNGRGQWGDKQGISDGYEFNTSGNNNEFSMVWNFMSNCLCNAISPPSIKTLFFDFPVAPINIMHYLPAIFKVDFQQ